MIEEKRYCAIRVDLKIHKRIKKYAAANETTMHAAVEKFCIAGLAKL